MPCIETFQGAWPLEEIVKAIEMSTERYDINVTYPEYRLSGQSLYSFNTTISDEISGYVQDFTDSAGVLILPDGRRSALQGQHSTYTAGNRFISAKVNFYPCFGGAHPGHDMLTSTFDTAANAVIALTALFTAESNYLDVLSQLTEKALFEKYPELDFAFNDPTFRKGFAPKEENFSRWALSDNGLIIFFSEYQVAPYAAGSLCVVIPLLTSLSIFI